MTPSNRFRIARARAVVAYLARLALRRAERVGGETERTGG